MLLDPLLARTVLRGSLAVRYPDGTLRRYGDGTGPALGIRIADRETERRLVVSPSLAFGEAWTDGRITLETGTLYDLVDCLVTAGHRGVGLGRVVALRQTARRALRHLVQYNPMPRARANAAHHYDVDRRLYELFLDRDMQYSCAYFETGTETLEEAQRKKKAHIARKLLLDRPGLEILDIGSGWGGMALHLAREHGARVLGITLSEEQLAASRDRARQANLSHLVRFELADYRSIGRNLDRPFDRVVSVGMFEHVGITHYPAFFAALRDALAPDGVALVHSIGRADGPAATNEWLGRHIFPGGYAPALSEALAAVETSGLWLTDCEILRLHYARTIACWRERFDAARDSIAAITGEPVRRMFELYLVGSEIAFRRLGHMNFQLQLAPRRDTVPLVRDYLGASLPPSRAPQADTAVISEAAAD